jgi:hypothetical protein
MAYAELSSSRSLLSDINNLLNFPVCDMNPSQEALIAVLNVSLVLDVNGQTKPLSRDQIKDLYLLLFTLAGNTELGDLLQRKVYQLSVELYRACLNS